MKRGLDEDRQHGSLAASEVGDSPDVLGAELLHARGPAGEPQRREKVRMVAATVAGSRHTVRIVIVVGFFFSVFLTRDRAGSTAAAVAQLGEHFGRSDGTVPKQ